MIIEENNNAIFNLRSGSKLYGHNVEIPKGTNCAPLLAHLSRRLMVSL